MQASNAYAASLHDLGCVGRAWVGGWVGGSVGFWEWSYHGFWGCTALEAIGFTAAAHAFGTRKHADRRKAGHTRALCEVQGMVEETRG